MAGVATVTIGSGFDRIHAGIREFLTTIEDSFEEWSAQSGEKVALFKERFAERLGEWQKIIEETRVFMADLPKELRHREITVAMVAELERAERLTKLRFAEWTDLLKAKTENWSLSLKSFREEVSSVYDQFVGVRESPVIERFIEGKAILPCRTQFQWGRKLFHTGNGLFGTWLYGFSGLSEWTVMGILAAFLMTGVVTEIVRWKSKRANEWVCKTFSGIMRESERGKISSATWYMGATLLVFLVFPKPVCILTLLFVALGDTAAGIVGVHWGRHKLSAHTSLEGSLAAFFVCFLATLLVTGLGLTTFHLAGASLFFFSFLAGLIGAFSEGIFKKLDDNLVISVVSAPLLLLLMRVFG